VRLFKERLYEATRHLARCSVAALQPGASTGGTVKRAGLIVALAALVAVMFMPAPQGLPAAGQVMLAILAFAVIVWMTEALDYAAQAPEPI